MTPETQHELERCECGYALRLRPTLSPWEFEGTCDACQRRTVKSWAHASPAPVFVKDGEPRQGSLL